MGAPGADPPGSDPRSPATDSAWTGDVAALSLNPATEDLLNEDNAPNLPGVRQAMPLLRRLALIAQQFTTRLAPIAPAEGYAGGAKLT